MQQNSNAQKLRNVSTRVALAMLLQTLLFSILGTLSIALQTGLESHWDPRSAHIFGQTVYGFVYFFSFAVPAWIFCALSRRKEEYRKGFYSGKLPRNMILILFLTIAINFALAYLNQAFLYSLFPSLADVMAASSETLEGYELVMMLFTSAIVPALCEEMLFRGAILSNLLPFGRTTAILGSALLFGLMHQNPMQFLYTATLGIVLGVLYVKTRSVWTCVLLHFVNNTVSIVQMAIPSFVEETAAVAIVSALEVTVVIGGIFGLWYVWRKARKEKNPEEIGSYGVVFEPHFDYAEYPVTEGKRAKLFFSPAMIVYMAIAVCSMILIFLSAGLLAVMGGVV